ncbi:MAG: hypothetical protein AAGA85_23870 [Bacteroidota bacterium]
MTTFYFIAGINHFRDADFYLPLIPDYLPWPDLINVVSGIAEIILAVGLIVPASRKYAAFGIIAMLVAFIPSHVYFIQIGGCIPDGLCAPIWVGWLRLLIIHPMLILWAWYHRS